MIFVIVKIGLYSKEKLGTIRFYYGKYSYVFSGAVILVIITPGEV